MKYLKLMTPDASMYNGNETEKVRSEDEMKVSKMKKEKKHKGNKDNKDFRAWQKTNNLILRMRR